MRGQVRVILSLVIGLVLVTCGMPTAGFVFQPHNAAELDLASLKPNWEIGDCWIVQTRTRRPQVVDTLEASRFGPAIQWRFTVQNQVQLADETCYLVEVRPTMDQRGDLSVLLWFERNWLALRQFQLQHRVGGNVHTVTEQYRPTIGQTAPVLGPLTVLPIDIPAFTPAGSKSDGNFGYTVEYGPTGAKQAGGLRFAFRVQQRTTIPKAEEIKDVLSQIGAKSGETPLLLKVELQRFDRRICQWWRAGHPWPVYCDNGATTARLISVSRANNHDQP